MRTFLRCVFALMLIGGVGIFAAGILMNLLGIGTDTGFYTFFNDNPWGWGIAIGLLGVGFLGSLIAGPIIGHFCDGYGYSGTSSYDDDYSSSSYDYGSDSSYSSDSGSYSSGVESRRYYSDGHSVGYSVGDRYYDNDGSCTGYDVGDRHYDSDGNSTGYRVGDREYDRDGNSVGYWVGDTFYDSDGNKYY